MSCNKLNTILLGGKRGADGIYAVQRLILFTPAGKLVADALPQQCELLYVRVHGEPELGDVPSVECSEDADFTQLVSTAINDKHGDVMLLSTPMPAVTEKEYLGLIDLHQTSGNAITRMTCGAPNNEWHAAICKVEVLKEILTHHPKSLSEAVRVSAEISAKSSVYRTEPHTAVRNACDAYRVQKTIQRRVNSALMERGVGMLDPDVTYISPYAEIGCGTMFYPGCMIRPNSKIGQNCVIGPNTILEQAEIGDRTTVNSSQVYESSVGSDATVGPFAYIRPGCKVGDDTRIGDFVELKKAEIGNGTKVSHLTYIGDATVGERVNFGCGTVVVNYDGYHKYQTKIGDDCFIGCNTNLVSPVSLGNRVLTAAGTTVTKDVPDGALAVARARQETREGWNDRRRKMHGQD